MPPDAGKTPRPTLSDRPRPRRGRSLARETTMTKTIKTDICVIGAGSAGLSVAAGAAQMGADVVLIEKGRMGGDCLNYGCVPSKALIAAGKAAYGQRHGAKFGLRDEPPRVDFEKVHDHVHGVIAAIAPHDSVERFEGLGCTVIQDHARFTGPRQVAAGDRVIEARRFVVATGSRAAVPPIPGLDRVPFKTNETIFDNTRRPDHLIIIGAGPIGLEMAQAHRRLGARVTVIEKFDALAKDDPELADVVVAALRREDIALHTRTDVVAVAGTDGDITVTIEKNGRREDIAGTELLVAAGRTPNLDGLDLDAAGIRHGPRGIEVDGRLRTSNRRVFAIGDAKGGLMFTHVAGYDAGIVIRNALFRIPAKADYAAVPWITYTDPELAHVGLTEAAARDRHGDRVRSIRWDYAENDRAQAERATEGFVKVVTGRGGRVLGASIVGRQAGELLQPWILAISRKLKMSAMAGIIAPYPTLGEINKRAAGAYYTDALFSDRTRKIVRLLQKLG